MKKSGLSLAILMLSTSAFSAIISEKGKLYIRSKNGKAPIIKVNDLLEKEQVKNLKLFGNGDVNLLSFKTDKTDEKLYSVDEKGFIYSIEPFASYDVTRVHQDGKVEFKQEPKKKYRINEKGFFLY